MRATKVFAICVALFGTPVQADFFFKAPLEGWFCSGWIFERCEIKQIDGLSETQNGQIFEFADRFTSVDEYNSTLGRCWLKNVNGYHAFEKSSVGNWNEMGVPRDVTFKCSKQ